MKKKQKKQKKQERTEEKISQEKISSEMGQQQDRITQLFGLSIVKVIDTETKQVHLEIKSKSHGLPIAEALLLVEGWVNAEKEKVVGPVFKQRKDIN